MGLQIEKTFVVGATPTAVWEFLTDPHRVARCLPGAAVTEKLDERTYAGTITVKVGPVSASYKGKLRFERLDADERSAEIVASGQDVRGKGGADLRMSSRLSERAPGETEVTATSEVNITGILAQFGRGMIEDVSDQMFQKFTEAMRAELESEGHLRAEAGSGLAARSAVAAPVEMLSLALAVVRRAAGRAVRRPGLWAAAAALALVIYWLWLR